MLDLITRERAIRNLDNRSATAEENLLIDALISAASEGIERYCNRRFRARQYDELRHGADEGELQLKNFPVLSIERVAYNPTSVLNIKNTSTAVQRATVKVTDTGLTLTRTASGTVTVNDLAFASYATISSLKTAIDALGNGWEATAPTATTNWPSSDLRAIQGSFNAAGTTVGLKVHIDELSEYDVHQEQGYLYRASGWHRGFNYWRVIYTAGFEAVPNAVQEACAQWVQMMFHQTKRDMGLANESIPSLVSRTPLNDLPKSTKLILAPFRVFRV